MEYLILYKSEINFHKNFHNQWALMCSLGWAQLQSENVKFHKIFATRFLKQEHIWALKRKKAKIAQKYVQKVQATRTNLWLARYYRELREVCRDSFASFIIVSFFFRRTSRTRKEVKCSDQFRVKWRRLVNIPINSAMIVYRIVRT